jgi:hypothetical protein
VKRVMKVAAGRGHERGLGVRGFVFLAQARRSLSRNGRRGRGIKRGKVHGRIGSLKRPGACHAARFYH